MFEQLSLGCMYVAGVCIFLAIFFEIDYVAGEIAFIRDHEKEKFDLLFKRIVGTPTAKPNFFNLILFVYRVFKYRGLEGANSPSSSCGDL